MADRVPAYVLGALAPEEARSFEQALAGSADLRRVVAEYREVSAMLATTASMAPPPDLRQRLMDRVGDIKSANLSKHRPPPSGEGSRFLRMATRVGLVAAIVATVIFGRRVDQLTRELGQRDKVLAERTAQLNQREAELNAILEPGVQLITLTTTGQAPPVVQVFWDRAKNSVLMHTFRLRQAPTGRAYQLWFLPKQGNPIASRVFNTEGDGHGLVTNIPVPADREIIGFAVSEEPAAGSPQPTSTPILAGTTPAPR